MANLTTTESTVETNLQGVKFGFDPDSFSKLSVMLTRSLYSKPELAVLHEIGANAIDAHVMAGKPDLPIEVSLPTLLRCELSIRDFGPGLSYEDILKYLTQYGKSSKESDNAAIGYYGIGSKSPAAVTDSWGITSYHNGTEIQCEVFVENGLPKLTKVFERETTETGLKVTIPVQMSMRRTWEQAAVEAFAFYDVTPVFNVAGVSKDIENIKNAKRYSPDMTRWWYQAPFTHLVRAKINQRMYDIPHDIVGGLVMDDGVRYSAKGITLVFKPGELRPTPNREAIQFDRQTKALIQERIAEVRAHYRGVVEQVAARCKDAIEYRSEMNKVRENFSDSALSQAMADAGFPYGIETISELSFISFWSRVGRGVTVRVFLNGESRRASYQRQLGPIRVRTDRVGVQLPADLDKIWLYNTDGEPVNLKRIKYLSEQNPNVLMVVMAKHPFNKGLPFKVVDQNSIVLPPAVAKKYAAASRQKSTGFYAWTDGRWRVTDKPVDPQKYYFVEIENGHDGKVPIETHVVSGIDYRKPIGIKKGSDTTGFMPQNEYLDMIEKHVLDNHWTQDHANKYVLENLFLFQAFKTRPKLLAKIFGDDIHDVMAQAQNLPQGGFGPLAYLNRMTEVNRRLDVAKQRFSVPPKLNTMVNYMGSSAMDVLMDFLEELLDSGNLT